MEEGAAIVVMGTFDSKGEEHLFLKRRIEERGFKAVTVNVGTMERLSIPTDIDLYDELRLNRSVESRDRDRAPGPEPGRLSAVDRRRAPQACGTRVLSSQPREALSGLLGRVHRLAAVLAGELRINQDALAQLLPVMDELKDKAARLGMRLYPFFGYGDRFAPPARWWC